MEQMAIHLDPVEALTDAEIDDLVSLVNAANADRRGPFRGDRIDKPSYVESYAGCTAIRAFEKTVLSGTVTIKPTDRALWIYLLAVAPASRGSGLGAQLLSFAAEIA